MRNRNRNLEKVLNGWPWAYSGSVAMKIHANRLGVPMRRNIGNINVAVDPNSFSGALTAIRKSNKWNYSNGPPGRNSKRAKLYRKSNGVNMNVLKANGYLAPKMNRVQKINGLPPIMSINALLNQKLKINQNDVFGKNKNKLMANIEFLRNLKRMINRG